MLDTNSTGADGPFWIKPGVEITEEGTGVAGVPSDWFQFDQYPDPTKIARCQLIDSLGPPPDWVHFGTGTKAYGTPPEWDYSNSVPREDITADGAAMMWWDPVALDPGDTFSCAIRFGAGTPVEAGLWDFQFHDPDRDTWIRGRLGPPSVVQYDWPGGSSGPIEVGPKLVHYDNVVFLDWTGPPRFLFQGSLTSDACQGQYAGAPHGSRYCNDRPGHEGP
jgi:hypothetical protein